MSNLDKEYQFFKENRGKFLTEYRNKFLVIKDQKIIGVYDTESEAYQKTIEKNKLGTFLLQQCVEEENEQKAIFHTRVIFA